MKRKIITIISLIVILVLAGVIYYRYYFVFGIGVKAGTLNRFVYKGYLIKTYEGRLIQSGINNPAPGSIQSNEFLFSVVDEKVAQQLNQNAGAYVELHYKEYLHTLPWRGTTNFVVDSVIAVQKVTPPHP